MLLVLEWIDDISSGITVYKLKTTEVLLYKIAALKIIIRIQLTNSYR